MSGSVDIPVVEIDPVGCYKQAFELVKGDYPLLLGVSVVGTLIGGAVPIILIGPMMCGVYMCFLARYRGDEFEFELLFKGFDLFQPSLIASLIMTAVSMLVFVPFSIITFAVMFASAAAMQPEGGQAAAPAIAALGLGFVLLFVLLLALIMTVGTFFIFTFPLIVDRKLSGTAAISVSAKTVWKNLAGSLGLMLIGAALALVGVLACYVGALLLMPISFAAMTIAYRKVFPEVAPEPSSGAGA